MRHYFFDASAVVKLYVAEPGSVSVRDIVRSARAHPPSSRVFQCDLAFPETVSALLQIERSPTAAKRGISRAALRLMLPRVHDDFVSGAALAVIPASDCIVLAANLVERHRLRPADALQVAAALQLQDVLPTRDLAFVSDDDAQCRAAEAEGLNVMRPSI